MSTDTTRHAQGHDHEGRGAEGATEYGELVTPDAAPVDRTPAGRPLRAAKVPKRPAGVGYLGMLLALALATLGGFLLYDGIVEAGWVDDAGPVLTPLVLGAWVVQPEQWAAVAGAVALLLGLWLLWTSLKPGRRAGVQLEAGTGVWTTRSDLERLAVATAERCDGVLHASADASRRTVDVHAETSTRQVEKTIHAAVVERFAVLAKPPRVRVRVSPRLDRHEGGAR